MPRMSRGQASSARLRSGARKNTGACTDITRPVRMFFKFMPRRKRPEEIRTKAMRSRCCGSILACTLNTKPATRGSSGEIGRGSAGCGRGAGGELADAAEQFAHPEIVERASEIDRRQMALAIGLSLEQLAQSLSPLY